MRVAPPDAVRRERVDVGVLLAVHVALLGPEKAIASDRADQPSVVASLVRLQAGEHGRNAPRQQQVDRRLPAARRLVTAAVERDGQCRAGRGVVAKDGVVRALSVQPDLSRSVRT